MRLPPAYSRAVNPFLPPLTRRSCFQITCYPSSRKTVRWKIWRRMSQEQSRVCYPSPKKYERDPGINSYPTRTLNNQPDETQMKEWPLQPIQKKERSKVPTTPLHHCTSRRQRLNIPWLRQTKPNLVDWEKDMPRWSPWQHHHFITPSPLPISNQFPR